MLGSLSSMSRIVFIILLFLLFVQAGAWASQVVMPSGTSYEVSSFVFETASVVASSSSYAMLGKTRDREIETPYRADSIYRLFEGFFYTIFKTDIIKPNITGILPAFGYNDSIVQVTISGSEFTGTTTVELTRGGENPIVGYNLNVTANTIVCNFDLNGKLTGFWNVFVKRADGLSDILPNGFEIRSPGLKIVGRPLNYPNPFNPRSGPTEIRYTLTEDADISLYIFNIIGERIGTFKFSSGQNGGRQGENIVSWNARSPFKGLLPSGVYICQIVANGKVIGTVKIAIVK